MDFETNKLCVAIFDWHSFGVHEPRVRILAFDGSGNIDGGYFSQLPTALKWILSSIPDEPTHTHNTAFEHFNNKKIP